ncbi:porin [Cupriavidus sp. WKF15]|uniref:porin n=1 Tax=Cupriavidus sp. WKF15 TaxID=3032282 RepID=UPI0023E0F3C2|nr:porin [Cupriavidus sp. WKF15]WER49419.1 porin [Cupriavidus sp. WKF15]
MKERLLTCAAVGLFSGAAHAQSSVTLYGVVDTNLEYVNRVGSVPLPTNLYNPGMGHSVTRLNSGGLAGSRWGLRGEEDLGAGMKSLFVLESGFQADTGALEMNNTLFDRQAYVGLRSNKFGQLTFGRQYTSLFLGLANFMPGAYSVQYEPIGVIAGPNFRENNAVQYAAVVGPVTAIAHWSFGVGMTLPPTSPFAQQVVVGGNGEVPGRARNDTGYGAALIYMPGAFGFTIDYDQYNPSIAQGSGTNRRVAVAASYMFDSKTKVMGGYRWGQNKDQNSLTVLRDDYHWLGANYQLTPSVELTLEYDYQKVRNLNGNAAVANPWQLLFMAKYSLSKRTDLYVSTAYARNAGLMLESGASGYGASLLLNNTYAPANGQTSMIGVAAGVRHIF